MKTKKPLDDPKSLGKIFCGVTRQKRNSVLRVLHYIGQETNTGRGCVMIWGFFAASGPRWVPIIDGTMNASLWQKFLKKNVLYFGTLISKVCELCRRTITWSTAANPLLKKSLGGPYSKPDWDISSIIWKDSSCFKNLHYGFIKTIL